jgi:hypothetical protein
MMLTVYNMELGSSLLILVAPDDLLVIQIADVADIASLFIRV